MSPVRWPFRHDRDVSKAQSVAAVSHSSGQTPDNPISDYNNLLLFLFTDYMPNPPGWPIVQTDVVAFETSGADTCNGPATRCRPRAYAKPAGLSVRCLVVDTPALFPGCLSATHPRSADAYDLWSVKRSSSTKVGRCQYWHQSATVQSETTIAAASQTLDQTKREPMLPLCSVLPDSGRDAQHQMPDIQQRLTACCGLFWQQYADAGR